MRTIERDIVGGFIISNDNKILLGHSQKGGVYQNVLIVPGGGIEEGETYQKALTREILEETGIDIRGAKVESIDGYSTGESKKTLRETGEEVLMKMKFYDSVVYLKENSEDVVMKFEDDYKDASWYSAEDLKGRDIGPATYNTMLKIGFIKQN